MTSPTLDKVESRTPSKLNHTDPLEKPAVTDQSPATSTFQISQICSLFRSDITMAGLKSGTQIGDMSILRLIAHGGMGEVYEAYDSQLDRRIALKIISPTASDETNRDELIRRFLNEARTHAKVNHPSIATIYSIHADSQLPYIAMEYIEGVSIKDYLAHYSIPMGLGIRFLEQLVRGVIAMAEAGVLHRDLKPGNIVIRADAQIKLIDFGIAKDSESDQTRTGIVIGSVPYLAPEIRAGGRADWYTECWSLGALFFEMLLRKRLIQTASTRPLPIASEDQSVLGPHLTRMIERMVAITPTDRYKNPDSLLLDVQKLRDTLPILSTEDHLKFQGRVKELIQRNLSKSEYTPPPVKSDSYRSGSGAGSVSAASPGRASPSAPPPSGPHVAPANNSRGDSDSRTTRIMRTMLDVTQRTRSNKNLLGRLIFASITIFCLVLAVKLIRYQETPVVETFTLPEDPSDPAPAPAPAPAPPTVSPQQGAPTLTTSGFKIEKPQDGQRYLQGGAIAFLWNTGLSPGQVFLEIAASENFGKILYRHNMQGTQLTISPQLKEGQYFWRLKSSAAEFKHYDFDIQTFTIINSRAISLEPSTSKAEYVTDGGEAEVDLSWQCKSGLDGYRVEVSNEPIFKSISFALDTNACKGNGLIVPVGRWYWRVKAAELVENQAFTSETGQINVRLRNSTPTPLIPPSLRVASETVRFEAPVSLRWSSVGGAQSYLVEISSSQSMSPILFSRNVKSESVSWRAEQPGRYRWRVRAIGSDGIESLPSALGILNVYLVPPSLKRSYDLRLEASRSTLRWPALKGAARYKVQIENNGQTKEHFVSEPAFRFRQAGQFSVRIAGVSRAGEPLSEFSERTVVNVSPRPIAKPAQKKLAPQLLLPRKGIRAPLRGGRVSILFKWQALPQVNGYFLEIAGDQNFTQMYHRIPTSEAQVLVERMSQSGKVFWRVCPTENTRHQCSETSHLQLD